MIFSRHIYWTILLRILLILATSGTGLWLIISQRGIIIGTLLIICSLFQIGGIVTYLNNINRKLRLFFDAIEDRDNTFSYPEQGINEELQDETITLLSIQDIDDRLNENESESWSKLSHVLTHEIMNTIAPIISLSQTLASYPEISEKGIRGLHIIQAQSERLMEFTESFRHLSYLPQPEKRLFSLSDLLHNLEELLQTNFQENNISFTLRCSPEPMMTEGDEKQLSQVFLNLLKNAMQALEGHPHGELSLQAEQDEYIVIDITDNGPGIPPEIMDKVFIPFFTTKSEGTGIGLSLCKEIIRRHEGHLAIKESRAGKTVFHIELP